MATQTATSPEAVVPPGGQAHPGGAAGNSNCTTGETATGTTELGRIDIKKLEFWEQDHAKAWEEKATGPRILRKKADHNPLRARPKRPKVERWTLEKSSPRGDGPTGTAQLRSATRVTRTQQPRTSHNRTPSTFTLTAGPVDLWLRTRTTAEGLFLETCRGTVEPTIVTLYQTPLAGRQHARTAATIVSASTEASGQLSPVETRVVQALIHRALGGSLTRREINLLAQVRALE